MEWRVGTGWGAGTCGELVQGVLSDGRRFHVTCPIEKGSAVSVRVRPSRHWEVRGLPPGREKLAMAIRACAELLGLAPSMVLVDHSTELEVGKGLGSSTADIVAAARAMATAHGESLSAGEMATLATSIEASDGSMYSEILAFDRDRGVVIEQYDWWPQFATVVIIPPETMDTASVDFAGQEAWGPRYDQLLSELNKAADQRDGRSFARLALESAELNQRFTPNALLEPLVENAEILEADGINVAHTGTCLGLLFLLSDGPEKHAVEQRHQAGKKATAAARWLRDEFPGDVRIMMGLTPACGFLPSGANHELGSDR